MLDIKRIRETPDVFRADLRKRGWDVRLIDELLEQDSRWRSALGEINEARAEKNRIAKSFGPLSGTYKKFDNLSRNLEDGVNTASENIRYLKSVGNFKKFFIANSKRREVFESIIRFCESLHGIESVAKNYDIAFQNFYRDVGNDRGISLALTNHKDLEEINKKLNLAKELEELAREYVLVPKWTDELFEIQVKKIVNHSFWPVDELWSLIQEVRGRHSGPHELASAASNRVKALESVIEESERRRWNLLRSLPNLTHKSVPEGDDESDNKPLRHWPNDQPVAKPNGISHVDLLDSLDVADLERAARAAGSRFFYLKGDLVMMAKALEFFALSKLQAKGFTPIDPPYLLRREAVEGAVDLADFEDVIYKVEAGAGADKGDAPELYLIATSEHPLAAMHMGEILEKKDLPRCYAGVSPCFRKEAGSHGKDTRGIFRVHQFSKVEMFVYCDPEESWEWHERLIANAEEIYRELGIPHRVVDICTGDLGTVAAKKYDVEAWMPVQGAYREVVSCSNCTDYQARRYNTRTWDAPGQPTRVLHTLNSTAVAVQRTLVAILENFQNPDGSVTVPEVLRPYLGGKDRIEPRAAA